MNKHWYIYGWAFEPQRYHFNIGIRLRPSFTAVSKELALDAAVRASMEQRAKFIVAKGWPDLDHPEFDARVLWHESVGLQAVSVPGNACDLGIDGGQLRDANEVEVDMYGHNIDYPLQQSALFALWLAWANTVEGRIND